MQHSKPIIVTMSTIPSRLKYLSKTVDSLLNQNVRPAEIRLYVPKTYRRFPDEVIQPELVDSRVRLCVVEKDLGPLTKIAYAAEEFQGADIELLACDDDMDYDSNWIELFVQERVREPDACLVQSGGFVFNFSEMSGRYCKLPHAKFKGFLYRLFRVASGLRWKPRTPYMKSGYVDIGEGWAGFFVSPKFFTPEFKNIPEEIFLVDDIWISAFLASQGVDIWLIKNALRPRTSAVARIDALNMLVNADEERAALNNKAVKLLRDRFGIWS